VQDIRFRQHRLFRMILGVKVRRITRPVKRKNAVIGIVHIIDFSGYCFTQKQKNANRINF
ncbi:MAG: hypothetical protein N3D11_08145, partial [Candidatus Sumerlaeia bacterium]|nr:hypothetical protein [Candidatus Sumerlaeia bacterium]